MRSPRWWTAAGTLAPLMTISLGAGARSSMEAGSFDGLDLCSLAAGGRLEEMRWPGFSDYRDRVESFYRRGGCAPVWIAAGQPTRQALE